MFSTEIFIGNLSPNMSGSIEDFLALNESAFSGCFEAKRIGKHDLFANGTSGALEYLYDVTLDASLCSTKYNSADTIQPCSAYSLMIIKA